MARLHKVLIIDTVLGLAENLNLEDELMLTELNGQEGISIPFFYDLTMARDPDKPEIDPRLMIGTMLRIGIARTNQTQKRPIHDHYVLRTGMILHWEKAEKFNKGGGVGDTSRSIYKAHVVPTFQILGREIRFRIFEELSAFEIIKRILEDMKARCPTFFRFNLDKLDPGKFPKMEYCVQFGESTYSFLCRLMNRFNMYYFYDHDEKQTDLPNLMLAQNETLFIGSFPNVPAKRSQQETYLLTDDDPSFTTIAGFQRHFEPRFQKMWFGNVNIIDPAQPPTHTDKRSPNFDLVAGHPEVAKYMISEDFPEPFANKSEAADYAIGKGLQEEEEVFSVSGATKNPSVLAGRVLEIVASKEEKADGLYLLKLVFLKGYEHSYLTTTATDISNLIFRDFLFAPFNTKKKAIDTSATAVSAALDSYLQYKLALSFHEKKDVDEKPWERFLGGITEAGLSGAITLLIDSVGKVVDANDGNFTNTFVAMPPHSGSIFRVLSPTPPARPIAYGPQTALVIGPDGIDTKQHDIFCDALGRVRVRFPWDPGPPRGKETLPRTWTADGSNSDFPLHQGQNTCWVRVSEAWAGRHYGTQFLPRIGQEVIVEFIAGDPERPIITGRVYNADKSTTNLPFPHPNVENTQLKNRGDSNGVAGAKELQDTTNFDLPLSGIKTWSMPTTKPDGGAEDTRFQLLRFSDKRKHEQYLIRAQHRLDITAFEKRYESIHSDRHLTVGGTRTTPTPGVAGDYITHVFRHYHLHVGDAAHPTASGNRTTRIEQNDAIRVVRNSDQAIGGNWSTSVGGQATIDANGLAGRIVLSATTNITLTVGASSIVITPASIAITSPMVLINSGGPPPLPPIAPTVNRPQDPTAADPGDTLTPPE